MAGTRADERSEIAAARQRGGRLVLAAVVTMGLVTMPVVAASASVAPTVAAARTVAVAPAHAVAEAPGMPSSDTAVPSTPRASSPGPAAAKLDPRQRQKLFVEKAGAAYEAARSARSAGKVSLAKKLEKISKRSQGHWVGDWNSAAKVRVDVRTYTRAARKAKRTPVLVVYAIPGRDCGGYSSGGLTPKQYKKWIRQVAKGLRDGAVQGSSRALVVLEPDALALDCVGKGRFALLRYATKQLAATGAWVYIDAGHSNWLSPRELAARLEKAGVSRARGFATNVSNFNRTAAERKHGDKVSAELKKRGVKLAHRHFVIDTSRNGRGPARDAAWCNPPGRGLGDLPRMVNKTRLDAYLWVKRPGESDGACQGGPDAGQWWQDYALELVKNRKR